MSAKKKFNFDTEDFYRSLLRELKPEMIALAKGDIFINGAFSLFLLTVLLFMDFPPLLTIINLLLLATSYIGMWNAIKSYKAWSF